MRHDILADVFSNLKNTESIGKKECRVPHSKMIESVLKVIKKNKYIGDFEKTEGNEIIVKLIGRINDCNVIKPHFAVKKDEFIKFEKRYLPARKVGILVVTTSQGVMDQNDAIEKNTGGVLLGYVY